MPLFSARPLCGLSSGVDLGQARAPTPIAVVQRVPATRIGERPDRPRVMAPLIEPRDVEYAPGSVEYARQQEARAAAATPAGAEWLPAP
jgi:hypothetical protein